MVVYVVVLCLLFLIGYGSNYVVWVGYCKEINICKIRIFVGYLINILREIDYIIKSDYR